MIEELDIQMDLLQKALLNFDADAAFALEGAAVLREFQSLEPEVRPREEVFLMYDILGVSLPHYMAFCVSTDICGLVSVFGLQIHFQILSCGSTCFEGEMLTLNSQIGDHSCLMF